LSDRFSLNAESVWTLVATDAWDGYNYGSGREELIRTSVGISYTLGKGVNLDRTPGFKDGRVKGLMDAYEELQSSVSKLSYDLNQAKKALLASEAKSASRQDSVVKALLANVEMRFAEAQKAKESQQNIGTVYFAFDRSELNSEALELLKQVASELRADSGRKVEVQAFSDEVGSAASNERIRRRRERAVVEFLLVNGVRKSQVESLPWNGSYSGVDTHDRRAEVKRLY
jgi:outer membrane protein OmpA-like peptidoglycan-associated protein